MTISATDYHLGDLKDTLSEIRDIQSAVSNKRVELDKVSEELRVLERDAENRLPQLFNRRDAQMATLGESLMTEEV